VDLAVTALGLYAGTDDVRSALDIRPSAAAEARLLRHLASASRAVDTLTGRHFTPLAAARTFDWPRRVPTRPGVLWMGRHELISVTSLTSGGTAIDSGYYLLYPTDGPPYERIELDTSDPASFGGGSTPQQTIVVTGVYGYGADTSVATTLAEALDATETGVDVDDSSRLSPGETILVDTEYMLITGRTMADTGVDIAAASDMTATQASTTLVCDTATGIPTVGETILIDTERMLVTDAAGTTLTVRRAIDGTVLAAHAADASIYAPRTLTVTRGALGTTAATHDDAATVYRHEVPGPVRNLTIAEAIVGWGDEQSGYTGTAGEGEASQQMTRSALQALRYQVADGYGRRVYSGVI
jgi:hypothetical protein